jgi:hypothetical protein
MRAWQATNKQVVWNTKRAFITHAFTDPHCTRHQKFKKLTTELLSEVGGYENSRGFCFAGGKEAGGWR